MFGDFRGFQRLKIASSFVTLGWVIMYDFKFERTENHNFTITTHTNQYVEFFHSLIVYVFHCYAIIYQLLRCTTI